MQLAESEVHPHQKSTGIKSFHQSQRIVIVYSLKQKDIFVTSCFGLEWTRFTFELQSVEIDTEHPQLQLLLYELIYCPCFFHLISTALLYAPEVVWPTLRPLPAHKQGFATQVRDLKLEAHDHNVDNELGFAGTFFSTDAANRSDWLPAWGMICLTRSTVSDSQHLRNTVFFHGDISDISPK